MSASSERFWLSIDPMDRGLQQLFTPPSVLAQAGKAIDAAAEASRPPASLPATPAKASSFSDAVMSTIKGGQDAQRAIFSLRDGMAPADALLDALQAVQALGDPERLRGFVRELQKRLERVA